MALKVLTVRDGKIRSHRRGGQHHNPRRDPNHGTSGNVLFRRVVRQFLDGQSDPPVQTERLLNDDYAIALVPRVNRKRQTGSVGRRRPAFNRILLLPLTWRALLQRIGGTPRRPAAILRFGDVRVDFSTMEIRRSEKPVALTAQQFKLLKFFTQSPERVISRGELLNQVWGYEHYPSTRTVDNHVWVLRQKLEPNPARPIHFVTVHGVGYKFVP